MVICQGKNRLDYFVFFSPCDIARKFSFNVYCSIESSTLSEELSFDLYSEADSEEPRYSVTVIDTPKSKLSSVNGDYGVFIVPNGMSNFAFILR